MAVAQTRRVSLRFLGEQQTAESQKKNATLRYSLIDDC